MTPSVLAFFLHVHDIGEFLTYFFIVSHAVCRTSAVTVYGEQTADFRYHLIRFQSTLLVRLMMITLRMGD
jgi:hypothetical protein